MADDQRRTTNDCLLYYITDRTAFAPDEPTRRRRLLEKIAEAARAGVDYIQLREKDLSTRELESLSRDAVSTIKEVRNLTPAPWPLAPVLLINSRTDIALVTGADGVHLRSDDVSPREVVTAWRNSHVGIAAIGCPPPQTAAARALPTKQDSPWLPLIGVSCHSVGEVFQAEANGASFAVFGAVFEKKDAPGPQRAGLAHLREACRAKIPVLALGGVTLLNARQCLEAGAAGIAAIRLFQENDAAKVVQSLHTLPDQ